MSGDLKTQIRDYTEFFMGTVESIDLEEIKERPLRLGEGAGATPGRSESAPWVAGCRGRGCRRVSSRVVDVVDRGNGPGRSGAVTAFAVSDCRSTCACSHDAD